jgi:hypothetical protein
MSSPIFNVSGVVGVEAVIAPGRLIPTGGLYFTILPFNYEEDGVRQQYSGVLSQLLTDDATNYVYLDYDGSLNVNTTGYPTTTHIRLGRLITSSGLVTTYYDDRIVLSAGIDKEINQNKAEAQDSTTSTDWQQKLRLTLTDIPEGTYIVQWYCELRHSNNTASERAEMKVEVNDTTEIGYSVWPYNLFEDSGGVTIQDISAGSHTIDLDYRQQGGGTAYIRRARLLFWRIA